jgi:glycosyltransferase involved in cell wall biosynthesis
MILGQLAPYTRTKTGVMSADQRGAAVARHDFLRAALRFGGVEGVHFFLPEHLVSSQVLKQPFVELQEEFPGRTFSIADVRTLEELAPKNKYIFPEPLVSFPRLGHLRQTVEHNPFPIVGLTHSVSSTVNALLYIGLSLFFECYDVVVATSEAGRWAVLQSMKDTSRFLAERLGSRSVSHPDVVTIPLGVDDESLSPRSPMASRSALGLPVDATIIEYVGRLTDKHKADLEPLLSVFRQLLSVYPEAYLVIAGSETQDRPLYSSALEQAARDIGIAHRMTIVKDFPFNQKSTIYSAADIFVSPVDNIQETFGLSILEAMACELPVVASDWSGYRDLITHGDCGFLVRTIWNNQAADWASRIGGLWGDDLEIGYFLAQNTVVDCAELLRYLTILVQNRDMRKKMGRRGRERVRAKFSWQAVTKLHQSLWQDQFAKMKGNIGEGYNSRIRCSYGETYGHFASVALQQMESTMLHCNTELTEECLTDTLLPYGVSRSVAERILASCKMDAQSVRALISRLEPNTGCTLSWLWKKGFLKYGMASDEFATREAVTRKHQSEGSGA